MSDQAPFQIEQTSAPDLLDEVFRLRVSVWRATGGLAADAFPKGTWSDNLDSAARHWVARNADGHVVGAARLTIHDRIEELDDAPHYLALGLTLPGPIAAPARVVVCRSARGCGLATQLLDLQDKAAQEAGARCAIREASPAMVRLLENRGWKILGPAPVDPRFPGVAFQFALFALNPQQGELPAWVAA